MSSFEMQELYEELRDEFEDTCTDIKKAFLAYFVAVGSIFYLLKALSKVIFFKVHRNPLVSFLCITTVLIIRVLYLLSVRRAEIASSYINVTFVDTPITWSAPPMAPSYDFIPTDIPQMYGSPSVHEERIEYVWLSPTSVSSTSTTTSGPYAATTHPLAGPDYDPWFYNDPRFPSIADAEAKAKAKAKAKASKCPPPSTDSASDSPPPPKLVVPFPYLMMVSAESWWKYSWKYITTAKPDPDDYYDDDDDDYEPDPFPSDYDVDYGWCWLMLGLLFFFRLARKLPEVRLETRLAKGCAVVVGLLVCRGLVWVQVNC